MAIDRAHIDSKWRLVDRGNGRLDVRPVLGHVLCKLARERILQRTPMYRALARQRARHLLLLASWGDRADDAMRASQAAQRAALKKSGRGRSQGRGFAR